MLSHCAPGPICCCSKCIQCYLTGRLDPAPLPEPVLGFTNLDFPPQSPSLDALGLCALSLLWPPDLRLWAPWNQTLVPTESLLRASNCPDRTHLSPQVRFHGALASLPSGLHHWFWVLGCQQVLHPSQLESWCHVALGKSPSTLEALFFTPVKGSAAPCSIQEWRHEGPNGNNYETCRNMSCPKVHHSMLTPKGHHWEKQRRVPLPLPQPRPHPSPCFSSLLKSWTSTCLASWCFKN